MRFLITAGPTREHLDPVRFLSNRSSGKMGYALAEAARAHGPVVLISGPVNLAAPPGVEFVPVVSAAEMAEAVFCRYAAADVVIMAAAVCDFRPRQIAAHKLKKQAIQGTLELEATPDILAELGRRKTRQVLVGFALETENLEAAAREKLRRKNLDWIVANEARALEAETNRVTIFGADGTRVSLPELPKRELAAAILEQVLPRIR